MSEPTIEITANGRAHTVRAGCPLDAFLASVGLSPRLVVVERNRLPLTPAEAGATTLQDGDVLEIARIVAGG